MTRSARAFHSAALQAMTDWAQFETLIHDVERKGIAAIRDSELFALVPALAPLNLMTGRNEDTEVTFETLLQQPVLLAVGESSTNFATFASSTGPSARRVQQLLRSFGKVSFAFAAADNVAVDLSKQLADPALCCSRLWRCSSCSARPGEAQALPPDPDRSARWDTLTERPDDIACETCRVQLTKLHLFMTLPLLLLRAALFHADPKGALASRRVTCAVGDKAQMRLRFLEPLLRTVFLHQQDIEHTGVLNHADALTDEQIKATLTAWAEWSNRLHFVLQGQSAAVSKRKRPISALALYLQFRKRQLVRFVDAWADAHVAQIVHARTMTEDELEDAQATARAHILAANRMADVLEKWTDKMDAFIVSTAKTEGTEAASCALLFSDNSVQKLTIATFVSNFW